MSTIVTRLGKGSPLTYAEGDANFTNLNNDKVEKTDLASTVAGKGASTVGLQDAGNYFATKTVEAALQQIGGATLSYFVQARNTAAPNTIVPVHSFTVNGTDLNIDAVFSPKGTGAVAAQVADGTVTGGDKRGSNSVDWQTSRTTHSQVASGNYSVLCGGYQNTVSGAYAFAGGGNNSQATGPNSVVGGGSTVWATGDHATAVGGNTNTASGTNSSILGGAANAASGVASTIGGGGYSLASGDYSTVPGGYLASTRGLYGRYSYASGNFSAIGDAQYGKSIQRVATIDATPTILTSDGLTPSSINVSVLPNNYSYTSIAYITAKNTSTGDTASWRIDGSVKRGATAASTTLVGTPAITTIAADTAASTWAVAMVANTTRGSVEIQVTGVAATNIHWVCKLDTVEAG